MPQDDTLDQELPVLENLLIYGRYFGLSRGGTSRAGRRGCSSSSSSATAPTSKVEPLSGGMKRRLTIARSLINEPEILLLDEPTTGLDPQARHVVWERLFRLKQQGVTLVLTTHYMDEAEQLCDRLVVMDDGRIAAEGSPAELIADALLPRGRRAALPLTTSADTSPRPRGIADRVEVLPDRLLLYVDDGDAAVVRRPRPWRAPRPRCSSGAAPSRTSSCGSPVARWSTDGDDLADRELRRGPPPATMVWRGYRSLRRRRSDGTWRGWVRHHVRDPGPQPAGLRLWPGPRRPVQR